MEVFDQGFEEGLDLSVAQGCRWGTLVLHWEGQGNPLDPGADPGGNWLNVHITGTTQNYKTKHTQESKGHLYEEKDLLVGGVRLRHDAC